MAVGLASDRVPRRVARPGASGIIPLPGDGEFRGERPTSAPARQPSRRLTVRVCLPRPCPRRALVPLAGGAKQTGVEPPIARDTCLEVEMLFGDATATRGGPRIRYQGHEPPDPRPDFNRVKPMQHYAYATDSEDAIDVAPSGIRQTRDPAAQKLAELGRCAGPLRERGPDEEDSRVHF